MPLDFQMQQFPFRVGVDEGTDPRQVPPGTLTRCENYEFPKKSRLSKRSGITPMTSAGVSSVQRLFTRGNELNMVGDYAVKTYSSQGAWASSLNSGAISNVGLERTTILDNTDGVVISDVAVTSDGKLMHAWVAGDPTQGGAAADLFYQIINVSDGAVLTSATRLDTSVSCVRILASGTMHILLWSSGANLKSLVLGTTTTLRSDVASTSMFDACIIGSTFVVAYTKATGIALYSYSIVASPVQQATGVVTGEAAACRCVSIDGNSADYLHIGYVTNTPAVRYSVSDPASLTQVLAPVNVDAAASQINQAVAVKRNSSTTCIYSYSTESGSIPGTYQDGAYRTVVANVSGTVNVGQRATHYAKLLSRPFLFGSTYYAFVANPINVTGVAGVATKATFAGVYLVAIETSSEANAVPHRYVGKLEGLTGGNWTRYYAANVAEYSATRVLFSSPFQSAISAAYTGIRQGVRLVSATYGASLPADMWRPITVGQETYLAAGVLTAFDGRQAFDYGFAHAPAMDASTSTTNAGGSQASGTYLYSIVPEYRSCAGILHRGPPAISYSIAVTGPSGTTTLSMVPVHLSQKSTAANTSSGTEPLRVLLALYRSVASSEVLQRLTVEPTYNTRYQTFGAPLTFADTRADTNLGTTNLVLARRPAIYTAGNVVDDEQPPACVTSFLFADRLWVLEGDRRTWWYSKAFGDDVGTAPGFSSTFRLVFDKEQTAGASMDDKAVFLSPTGVSYLIGQGPGPDGSGNDFAAAVPIPSETGCTNARSVVSTPIGVMFQGTRGVYLVTRDLQVVFLGRPLQDTFQSFPNITSAVLVASKNQVRFTANDVNNSNHCVFVYDYDEKQWSTFRYTHSGLYGYGAIADACMWRGTYTMAMTDGTVYTESTTSWLDNGSYSPGVIETAWIAAAGPLGYQSVRSFGLEGTSNEAHVLTIDVGYNGETNYGETHAFAEGSTVTTAGPMEACVVSIGTRRKCQLIRFRITDTTPAAPVTGQGPQFDMMAIEVGAKAGRAKRPAGAQA